jgi:regulator of sigma D
MANLSKDLSGLGELLEERFQIEDSLNETLHTSHKEMIA